MTTKLDDGGPAFPQGDDRIGHEGMTLRDWFAGQALSVLVERWSVSAEPKAEGIARFAYRMADAMLKERDRD